MMPLGKKRTETGVTFDASMQEGVLVSMLEGIEGKKKAPEERHHPRDGEKEVWSCGDRQGPGEGSDKRVCWDLRRIMADRDNQSPGVAVVAFPT